jgi:hypothetical protein
MTLSGISMQNFITDLLPKAEFFPKVDPFEGIKPKLRRADELLFNLLPLINDIRGIYIQWAENISVYDSTGTQASNPYLEYLQFPNQRIKELAMSIVDPRDTNDEKMEKIQWWIIENIRYVTDQQNYGLPENWALPVQTLKTMSGDCEDGAFLLHSLALNAGVPPSRLRTYGGIVETKGYAPFGGHGWTAYQRESDDEWVVLDWCYYPNTDPIAERPTMAEDLKYFEDYFWINVFQTYDASITNTIRAGGFHVYV